MLAPVRHLQIRAEIARDRFCLSQPERLPTLRFVLETIEATEELITRARALQKSSTDADRVTYLAVATQVKAHIAGIEAALATIETDSLLPTGITIPIINILPDDVGQQVELLWSTTLRTDAQDRQDLAAVESRLRLIHAGRILGDRANADQDEHERNQLRRLQTLAEKYLPAAQ